MRSRWSARAAGRLRRRSGCLSAGLVDPPPLISETFALDQAAAAFARAVEPGVLKVLLEP